MGKRITETAVAQARQSEAFVRFSAKADEEAAGIESANSAAIETDVLIAEAVADGNGPLLAAMAEKLGLKRGSAMLTHRANIGRLAKMPTDMSRDKLRIIKADEKKVTSGEKYFRGRLRKYLDIKAKEHGIKPSEVMDDLLGMSSLPDVLDRIEAELDPKNSRKESLIENYFMGGPSIKKAVEIIESGKPYEGDLDVAKTRAEEMKVALDHFLSIV